MSEQSHPPFNGKLFTALTLCSCMVGLKAEGPLSPKQAIIDSIYTADPSAHVFNGKIYLYPSHDVDTGLPPDNIGSQYDMRDYRVLSLDFSGKTVTDHGEALHLRDVPWASKQLWAPDAACKDGRYFLYFPAKDKQGVFRIGVATSDSPSGPFVAQKDPIKGSFSIDPASFMDDDGQAYLYFGGLWGGQLERHCQAKGDQAIWPRVAKLSPTMLEFAESPRELVILDESGKPLRASDSQKRFFEAAWMHKYRGRYYFSYSTGDTHRLVYAVADNPYGPFSYRGLILNPVKGWTTHHSILEYKGTWYLFYHDASLSGRDHLRCVKYQELRYDDKGDIVPMNG